MTSPRRPSQTVRGSNAANSPAAEAASQTAAKAAERRRQALRRLVITHHLSIKGLARRAGLRSANGLYNFLAGRSASLSQNTLERILRAFPGLSLDEIVGHPVGEAREGEAPGMPEFGQSLRIVAEAAAGIWHPRQGVPDGSFPTVAFPPILHANGGTTFGVIVTGPGAELLYRQGAILQCRPPATDEPVRPGQRVIVRRSLRGRSEITVKQIVLRDGRRWLWPRSDHPTCQAPIALDEEKAPGPRTAAAVTTIVGVVLASWQPEPNMPE